MLPSLWVRWPLETAYFRLQLPDTVTDDFQTQDGLNADWVTVCVLTVPSNPGRVGSADDTGWVGEATVCSWLQRGGRGWGWAGAAVPAQQWKVYPSHRGAQGSVGGRPTEAPNPCSQRQGPQGSPGALQPFSAGSGVSPEWAGLQRPAESKAPGLTSPHFFSICSCYFSLLLQLRTLSPLPVTSCHCLGAHQLLPWEPHPPRFSGLSWVLKAWIFTFPLCVRMFPLVCSYFSFLLFSLDTYPLFVPTGIKTTGFPSRLVSWWLCS